MTAVMEHSAASAEPSHMNPVRQRLRDQLERVIVDAVKGQPENDLLSFEGLVMVVIQKMGNEKSRRMVEEARAQYERIVGLLGAIDTVEQPERMPGHSERVGQLQVARQELTRVLQPWLVDIGRVAHDLHSRKVIRLIPRSPQLVHVEYIKSED